MSISRADIETTVSVTLVTMQDAQRELDRVRGTAPSSEYCRALSALHAAEAEHFAALSQRERQRADEVAADAVRAGI